MFDAKKKIPVVGRSCENINLNRDKDLGDFFFFQRVILIRPVLYF
jgi:hypothetical protein